MIESDLSLSLHKAFHIHSTDLFFNILAKSQHSYFPLSLIASSNLPSDMAAVTSLVWGGVRERVAPHVVQEEVVC